MEEHLRVNRLHNTDLDMYQCGEEICQPNHGFGPAVRDHYLIHYIIEGKGFFQVGEKRYDLEAGQGFLICPDSITYYEADGENPWHYVWVGFHGLKAKTYLENANLDRVHPIFTYQKDKFVKQCFEGMIGTKQLTKSREVRLLGYLHLFLSALMEDAMESESKKQKENNKEFYIKRGVEYIQRNYSRKITIEEIADYIGLDRSYFYSIFKERLNISPKEFLIVFRMNKACELMSNTELLIGDIARSVGYEDPLLFSKIFKKIKGKSPSQFRKVEILYRETT